MASRRQHKLESLFQEELGKIFLEEGKHWFGNSFITVTYVVFSPDLRHAKVYISLHGIEDPQSLFKEILAKKGELKRILGQRLRNQVKKIPDMDLYLDDSIDRAARIDELLKK